VQGAQCQKAGPHRLRWGIADVLVLARTSTHRVTDIGIFRLQLLQSVSSVFIATPLPACQGSRRFHGSHRSRDFCLAPILHQTR
jgi:hypothetical protein